VSSKKKKENPWTSLIFNVVLPSLVLSKLSGPKELGPQWGLIAALAFPLAYSAWDYWQRRTFSFITGIGIVGVVSKGTLGLVQAGHQWIALNEAAVPAVIALALYLSMRMERPLLNELMFNENVMNVAEIQRLIEARQKQEEFAKLLVESTWLLIVSFLISAVLNYGLAVWLLKSPPGTEELNKELGTMNAVSMPVILLCSSSVMVYALWRMIKKLEAMTGLSMEGLFAQKH
jgi:intracellular septation protein A